MAGVTSITHREIPNNGSNIVSTQEFKAIATDQASLEQLRTKTAKYRYVKIKIIAVMDNPDTTKPITPPEYIKKYRFELVKVVETSGKTRYIASSVHFKQKKFKCKRPKGDHSPIKCSFQR